MIELVVVLTVVGILAVLAVPKYVHYLAKSQQSEAKANLGAIYVGMLAYTAPKESADDGFSGATLENIGFASDGMTRYRYSLVSVTTNAFLAKASGVSGKVDGDVWVIDQNREMNDVDDESFNR